MYFALKSLSSIIFLWFIYWAFITNIHKPFDFNGSQVIDGINSQISDPINKLKLKRSFIENGFLRKDYQSIITKTITIYTLENKKGKLIELHIANDSIVIEPKKEVFNYISNLAVKQFKSHDRYFNLKKITREGIFSLSPYAKYELDGILYSYLHKEKYYSLTIKPIPEYGHLW